MEHSVPVSGNPGEYQSPAIIFDGDLEILAGSPLSMPDALDLFGTGEIEQ